MYTHQEQAFQLSFNRFLRVAFQGSRVSSNGGLILVREFDERLGFGKLAEQHLTDPRMNAGAIIDQGAPRKRRFLVYYCSGVHKYRRIKLK